MVKFPKIPMYYGRGICAAFVTLVLGSMQIPAAVLYSTFGPGDTFGHNGGYGVIWNNRGGLPPDLYGNGIAVSFTSQQDSRLSSVTLALEEDTGRRNLAVSIYADNMGAPGALLETTSTSPATLTNSPAPVTFESSLQPILSAGALYWLVLEPERHNTADGSDNVTYLWWNSPLQSLSSVGYREFDLTQSNWKPWRFDPQTPPAFRVDGFAIPEPTAMSLAMIGLGLARLRFRRRKN